VFVVRNSIPSHTEAMEKRAMHTIALVSRKGGTGKSILAIGLAVAAIEAGHRICLLEADPLGTVSNWRRRRTSAEPRVKSIHDGYMLFHGVHSDMAHPGWGEIFLRPGRS
jgi:hypothetical protein